MYTIFMCIAASGVRVQLSCVYASCTRASAQHKWIQHTATTHKKQQKTNTDNKIPGMSSYILFERMAWYVYGIRM